MDHVGPSSEKHSRASFSQKRSPKGSTALRSSRVCKIVSGSILKYMEMVCNSPLEAVYLTH